MFKMWKLPSQVLPLSNCATLHKLLNLSVSQFLHLDNNSANFRVVLYE